MTTSRDVPDDLMEVGQLRAPYGLKGWFWLYSETDPLDNIFEYIPWWIYTDQGYQQVKVKSWRPQGKGLVVLLDHIQDRTDAEKMVGKKLYISRSALPAPDVDEYYWSDLTGMQVRGIDESDPSIFPLLGVLSHLFETGANDVMVIKPTADSIDQEERLIPWHRDTVLKVDAPNRTIYTSWALDY